MREWCGWRIHIVGKVHGRRVKKKKKIGRGRTVHWGCEDGPQKETQNSKKDTDVQ